MPASKSFLSLENLIINQEREKLGKNPNVSFNIVVQIESGKRNIKSKPSFKLVSYSVKVQIGFHIFISPKLMLLTE